MSRGAFSSSQMKASLKEDNQMCLAFERRMFDRREAEGGRMGCTLVTGFLGSGKTTLVHHILKQRDTLRIAVLVNEYAEIDIDSVLLQSSSMNAAYGLSSVRLSHGCACCDASGSLRDAILTIMNSKHNFDYLVIEVRGDTRATCYYHIGRLYPLVLTWRGIMQTSGVADPSKIAKDLEDLGVRLDLIVTVVDAEALSTILNIPVAKKQLEVADIILINKCDLALLGAISDVEDHIEDLTGGTKAIRCRFCNVPLDLVLNITVPINPILATTSADSTVGIISHEPLSSAPLLKTWQTLNISISPETLTKECSSQKVHSLTAYSNNRLVQRSAMGYQTHEASTFRSVTFSSIRPLSLAVFQAVVLKEMHSSTGLLRAKGVLWFDENRSTRFYFHWSGKKRAEAVYGGIWESQPSSSLVFIGHDGCELDLISDSLNRSVNSEGQQLLVNEATKIFSRLMAADNRFKMFDLGQDLSQYKASCHFNSSPTCVTFTLIGSRLRGVHEADLNATLMRTVNKNGVYFLIPVSSSREDHILQLSFGDETDPELAWHDISTAATVSISKCFKNVCLCRCDMTPHRH